jgi:hypothetical protein
MDTKKELKVLVVDLSITEGTMLMVLLSPLSRDLTICSRYSQGVTVLQNAQESHTPFDLVFLALPPDHHPEIDMAVKVLALALAQTPDPQHTVILGGDTFPPAFIKDQTVDTTVLNKPMTREKLQQALVPLAITLPRLNCWEYMRCGREPGGLHVVDLGVCPVSEAQATHGLHGGECGGRACWAIGGTLCGGKVQGSFASKIKNCLECDFYHLVKCEEGDRFSSIDSILNRLRRNGDGNKS